MKCPFKLGDKVIVQAVLEKQQSYENCRTLTHFVTKNIPAIMGIFIGYRTALTGSTRYSEDGPEFKPQGKEYYYLVVTNERQNPIKVPPNSCL